MFIINPYIFGAAGYTIENAIWLDGSADYLSRTPTTTGTPKTQTFSFWTKANVISGDTAIFAAWPDDSNHSYIDFNGGGEGILRTAVQVSGSNKLDLRPTAAYRDTTAWKHWVFVYDFTNGTEGDRTRIYQNGVRLTAFGTATYPATTDTPHWATDDTPETIGAVKPSSPLWFANIYLAEFIRLDGTAVTDATSFGEFDDNGVWVPIDPSGLTFGTNGFQLNFSNANALGLDVSRGATHPGTVDLQISFDGSDEDTSTTDESANSHTVTFEGDAELDDAQYKFSPSSLLLDGTGDYVKCADNADWRLGGGTGDFTLEFFARLASGVTAAVMVGQEQNATTDFWAIYWNNSAGLQFINRTGSTNTIYFAQGSNSLSVTTWYHIALVRSGSVLTFYVNGSSVATASSITAAITDFSGELRIGHNTGSGAIGTAAFNGHIDEFRLINGGAVYNGNFTALSAAFGAPENKTNNSFTQVSIASTQQVTDTCTDDADNIGNTATFNPLQVNGTISEGNLKHTADSSGYINASIGTVSASSGKFYHEIDMVSSIDSTTTFGVVNTDDLAATRMDQTNSHYEGHANGGGWAYRPTPKKWTNSTQENYGVSVTDGDTLQVYTDLDNGKLYFGKNGTLMESANLTNGTGYAYDTLSGQIVPAFGIYQTDVIKVRFSPADWEYTPASSDYKSWSTQNLPAPTVKNPDDGFALITLEDGDTIEASLANKRTGWGSFIDVFFRETDGQDKEVRFSDDSGNSMHFNTNAAAGSEQTLSSGVNYSAFSWRVGATYGCYTAEISHSNGSATNQAHGLGSGAKSAVAKRSDSTGDWYVSHPNLSSANVRYNVQEATTSELVTVDGTNVTLNSSFASGTYRVIVWEQIEGFSAFTGYSHNGSSDGPYVHFGGLASLVLWRNIDSSNSNDFFSTFPSYTSNGNGNPTDVRYNWGNQEKGYTGITIGDVTAN